MSRPRKRVLVVCDYVSDTLVVTFALNSKLWCRAVGVTYDGREYEEVEAYLRDCEWDGVLVLGLCLGTAALARIIVGRDKVMHVAAGYGSGAPGELRKGWTVAELVDRLRTLCADKTGPKRLLC